MSDSTAQCPTCSPRPRVSSAWMRRAPSRAGRRCVDLDDDIDEPCVSQDSPVDGGQRRRRRSRTRTRGAPCRRAGSVTPPRSSPSSPRTCFWVDVAPQQLGRTTMDRNLGLELADSPLRGCQLLSLATEQARFEPTIDAFLSPPVVDGLLADTEVRGDRSTTLAAGSTRSSTRRRNSAGPPFVCGVLLRDSSRRIQNPTPRNPGGGHTELRTSTGPRHEKRCTKGFGSDRYASVLLPPGTP